jgi:hypothetical protein
MSTKEKSEVVVGRRYVPRDSSVPNRVWEVVSRINTGKIWAKTTRNDGSPTLAGWDDDAAFSRDMVPFVEKPLKMTVKFDGEKTTVKIDGKSINVDGLQKEVVAAMGYARQFALAAKEQEKA